MNRKSDLINKFIEIIKKYCNTIFSKIISQFSKDPILKGLVVLGSGSAISQVLVIIFIPIITRIYPPVIYGTLAVFTSLISLLTVLSTLKYDFTISIPEKDADAEYLLILSLFITGILTIILFVILTCMGNYLGKLFHFEFIEPYYWLFCIGFLTSSLYNILIYWNLRSKDYIKITKTRVAQSLFGSISKIILGILSAGSLSLISGDIIGRFAGINTLGRTILPKIWVLIRTIDYNKMRSLAYTYRKFPTFSLPSGFINEISLQIPTLFIATIFGFQIVGLYALSFSIIVLPVSLVSGSIAQVFIAESSELIRQKSDKIHDLYLTTTKKLFMFGAPLILTGAILLPFLFPIIFGNAWKDAGMFVLPLSIMVVSNFVVSSTDRLDLYGYNHWELAWNISRTFFVLLGFLISFQLKFTPVATILMYSLIMTFMYIINYILNVKAINLIIQQNII